MDSTPEFTDKVLNTNLKGPINVVRTFLPSMIEANEGKIINIHHSFLPSFKGARPYNQAFLQGVKIIGATAHYVTEELDEGPIICQDVIPVNHMHSSYDMMQLGREIERNVLYKAVKSHLECKIVVTNNKTIVFK